MTATKRQAQLAQSIVAWRSDRRQSQEVRVTVPSITDRL